MAAQSTDLARGTLKLPSNGLVAGTNQLVLRGGNVGIGTAAALSNICGVATGEHVAATESRISHTGNSLRVLVGSTLDQVASDESFGIDNLEIWVR